MKRTEIVGKHKQWNVEMHVPIYCVSCEQNMNSNSKKVFHMNRIRTVSIPNSCVPNEQNETSIFELNHAYFIPHRCTISLTIAHF